ncbi:MAG: hypothetical protein H0X33_14455 [Taibaiella sp.]|nr:hypothetical protein [Taibaiella sp.]
MEEKVTFELGLKDLLSEGLKEIQSLAQLAFGGIDKSINATKRNLSDLAKPTKIAVDASAVDKVNQSLKNLKSTLNKLGPAAPGGGGGGLSSFGKMIGASAIGNYGAQAAIAAARKLKETAASTLEQGMNAERTITGLSTFVGDKKAQQIYDQLQKQAVYTPFTSSQLLQVERGMLPYKSPTYANKATMGLANAVTATGGSDYTMERMGWHMQQMAATGKMEGIQAREFGFAGIPIYKLLADAFMPAVESKKAQEKLHNMTISFDMVNTALEKAAQKGGMFADALEKQSQTIYGKWTTIKDFWQIGQQKMTLSQSGNIKSLEDMAIAGLQGIPEMVSKITPFIGGLFDTFKTFLPDLKDKAVMLGEGLKPIVGLLLSDGFKSLAHSVMDLTTDIGTSLIPAISLAAQALAPLARLTGRLTTGIDEILNPQAMAEVNAEPNSTSAAYWANQRGGGTVGIGHQLGRAALVGAQVSGHNKFKTWDEFADFQLANQERKNFAQMPAGLFPNPGFRFDKDMGGDGNAPVLGKDNKGYQDFASAASAASAAEKADKITGGGRRIININFNKSAFDIQKMIVEGGGGRLGGIDLKDLERKFEMWLVETLQSLNLVQ